MAGLEFGDPEESYNPRNPKIGTHRSGIPVKEVMHTSAAMGC